jgi:hypothetical protein
MNTRALIVAAIAIVSIANASSITLDAAPHMPRRIVDPPRFATTYDDFLQYVYDEHCSDIIPSYVFTSHKITKRDAAQIRAALPQCYARYTPAA